MSVINQMLKDLELRQQGSEGAVYVPPVRQQGWWMLVLTLICGLALGILGWRTWIYWQQSQRVVPQSQVQATSEPRPDAVARVVPVTPADEELEPVDLHQADVRPRPSTLARARALEQRLDHFPGRAVDKQEITDSIGAVCAGQRLIPARRCVERDRAGARCAGHRHLDAVAVQAHQATVNRPLVPSNVSVNVPLLGSPVT